MGRALAQAVNLLNPQRIVIGGGVARSLKWLLPSVREELRKSVSAGNSPEIPIDSTGLGYEAGLRGAAALALQAKGGTIRV